MWRDFDKMASAITKTLDKIKKTEKKKVMDYTNNGIDFSGEGMWHRPTDAPQTTDCVY